MSFDVAEEARIMKGFIVATALVSIVALTACSSSPVAPTVTPDLSSSDGTGRVSAATATTLEGVWTGTTVSTSGGSDGTLRVTFTAQPGNSMHADVVWASDVTAVDYYGDVHGTLDNISVQANSMQACSFKATGVVDTAGTTMTGTYNVNGNQCKSVTGHDGTFSITKQ
jgi:hypothetical protein